VESQKPKTDLFFSSNRLEALTDGVFAIAMTLLVFGLKIPDLPRHASGPEVTEALLELLLPFAKYVLSFLLLGGFWVLHVRQIHCIRRVDVPFLWLGMGSLLLVTLMPFSTSLVSDFPGRNASEAFFHLNIFGISGLFALQWLHAVRNRSLISPDLPEETVERDVRLNQIIPALSIMGLVTVPLGDFESNLIYFSAPLLFFLVRRFQ
jgi:uncharacterized membrane protein